MSNDELFAEMHQQGIEHLGQVRVGLLETTGALSILLFAHKEVRYDLPIFPKQYQVITEIETECHYACMECGYVEPIWKYNQPCARCQSQRWAKAMNNEVVR